MPYPKSIEEKLGFAQIKEMVSARCLSSLGQYYVSQIRFVHKPDVLQKLLVQTNEFKQLLAEGEQFPADNYVDVRPLLKKLQVEGIWLLEEELHQIKLVLTTFVNIARFFKSRSGTYENLAALIDGLTINDLVIRRIERILDAEGNLKPNATPELAKISAKIHDKETEIRKRIIRLFDKNQNLGYLTENIGITIREGRLVLPVLAEHKTHVPGFMHDESQTGQTVFIEPTECFDLNNMLRELQIAYRRERERILLEVTDTIRPETDTITANLSKLGLYDFIRAKALLAIEMNANMPLISAHPGIRLEQAYHPLLKLNHDKQGLQTIPLSLTLNKDQRIMLISGPNAGGKSVCLKTVGLLQYMFQCGLLITAQAHSELGLFKDIMIDIGDEQSIDNDLSTYSSHLLHMKHFTTFAGGSTLFLIDEFGMGTDPQFGGPLAEAILHQLVAKNALGIVTTHFSNLKTYAANTTGLVNACMLFDTEKLKPLYKLEVGKPGSSYAFELAQQSGLNQQIIEYARRKIGGKQQKVDDLLLSLEKEQKHLHELKERYREKEARADVYQQQYQKLKTEIETQKRELIKKAKQEALSLVTEANSKIEALIRELKQQQASAESQKLARQTIKQELSALKSDLTEELVQTQSKKQTGAIGVGSFVKVGDQESVGQVISIIKQKVVVAYGELRTTTQLSNLVLVEPNESPQIRNAVKGIDFNAKLQHFNSELNLIGTRGEEAFVKLQEYLDDALLLGVKQVRIVHGKGYGILRNLVRDVLRKSKAVEHFADEHIDLGGDGVTVVTLKQ